MMQKTQIQPPYTSWTSWPPVTEIPSGGFASVSDIYSRTYSTTVFATPIKRTVEESRTTAVFPVSDCPPVSHLRKTCYDNRDLAEYRKPNCSYTVLIGMALKASKSGDLPVSEIYKYIQQEFPFFKTCGPDGWKNSVRHSLSLGQYFRKVERKDGYQGKKGFHWEVVPEKKAALHKEVERFMREEGLVKVEMTAARAATSKTACTATVFPATPVQSVLAKPVLTFPLESMAQEKSSTAQSGVPSDPVQTSISSAESIGVAGAPGPSFSVSNAQISQSSLEQLLSTLGTLDAPSLQKLSLGDTQNLMFILNKNAAAVTTTNTPSLESISSTSNPQPALAAFQHVSKEPLTTLSEMTPSITVVPSEPKLSTSGSAPILPALSHDLLPMQLNSASTSEHSIQQVKLESISEDFPQPSTPVQPGVAEISSDLPVLQPDANMQKETDPPNTDIVAFADLPLFTSNNLCDNCKAVRSRIKQLASESGVPLPEDTNNTAGTRFTPSNSMMADKLEAELSKQKSSESDFMKCEVDRAIELYCSTHPALPLSATSNDIDASTDNYHTLNGCNGMGNIRPMVDLRSLAVTGCVQKSTIYVDVGHLNSKSPFIDPLHPRANITLAQLNQEPALPLDPHHSATAPYCTPDDVDGTPHSDSFTRAIAPVYCNWNCWNDPEYAARMLQQDLEDFDKVLRQVTLSHEQERREEEERKRRLGVEETHGIHGDFSTDSTIYNQSAHTCGKWSPSCSDWNELVESGERDLTISIPLTKFTPKSASKCKNRKVTKRKRSRKRKLEDRDDVTGGEEKIQLKKKKKYIPAMFCVFMNSDESETELD